MKVLLLPLDERPCNRVFPQLVASMNPDVELIVPPTSILGDKKKPADVEAVASFMLDAASECDAAVLALDTLLYGGLIPSRLHHLDAEEAHARLGAVHELKRANPSLKVYAFMCIMRAPQYDSAEEEPDYYGQHGRDLFRRRYLMDKRARMGSLEGEEAAELEGILIPREVLSDYEERRLFNEDMNIEALGALASGDIDFLVIPQDDSSPFGYTAISQKRVIAAVADRGLSDRVMVYPGADEVGMSLLARAYVEFRGVRPRIWPFYASTLGPTIVPNYEDRPMFESLKSHVRACGATFAENPAEADVVLAINAPGKVMQEAFVSPVELDVSYTSYRQLDDFCCEITDHLDRDRRVALCDSAFSNGGDPACIERLDRMGALGRLCSYAGWNTNCNTLGTVLAQALVGTGDARSVTAYRLIEDVFYQADVRQRIIAEVLPELGLSYYDFGDKQGKVEEACRRMLQERFDALGFAQEFPVEVQRVYMPWHRMFEIGLELSCGMCGPVPPIR